MRSDDMKKGVEMVPHRALLRALGLTDAEIERLGLQVSGQHSRKRTTRSMRASIVRKLSY
jgi:hypothetical protein